MKTPFSSPRDSRVALALSVLLLLIIVLAFAAIPDDWIPVRRWGAMLESAGVAGMLLYLLIGTLGTAVGLPRQLLAFTGGLAYGPLVGLLLSWAAALGGCHACVQLSRRWLRQPIRKRYPAVIESLSRLLHHETFLKVLILRLQPLGTNLMTNLCVGFTPIDYRRFLLATAVGYVPQMLVFVLLGAGVRVGDQTQALLTSVLILISVFLALLVYQRHRRRLRGVSVDIPE